MNLLFGLVLIFISKNCFSLSAIHIPLTVNSVVLTFNVPGVTSTVNLTPQLLALIFQGNITQWNHPEIIGQ